MFSSKCQNVNDFLKGLNISYKDKKSKLLDVFPTNKFIKSVIRKQDIEKIRVLNSRIREQILNKKKIISASQKFLSARSSTKFYKL